MNRYKSLTLVCHELANFNIRVCDTSKVTSEQIDYGNLWRRMAERTLPVGNSTCVVADDKEQNRYKSSDISVESSFHCSQTAVHSIVATQLSVRRSFLEFTIFVCCL
jgi:hypothetical protein